MPPVPRFASLDEDGRRELWAVLALRHCPGLGSRGRKRIFERFGSAFLALEHKASWDGLGIRAQALAALKSEIWREAAKLEWDAIVRCNPHILFWHSETFPELLRQIPDSPILLYGEGDFSLLKSPCVAVVGARNASPDGCRIATYMARNLAACGISVVAGMATGIDSCAHRAALGQVGGSIGVLGTGIDVEYPRCNGPLYDDMRRKGLLLAEYAPQTKPLPGNFPVRNRIISGLSLGVLVVEAAENSGSLITARLALEQNRDVYAVPGPALNPHCSGCQKLVRDGAHPVFTVEDILRDLAPRLHSFGVDTAQLLLDHPDSQRATSDDNPCESQQSVHIQTVSQRSNIIQEQNRLSLEPEQQKVFNWLQVHGASHTDQLAIALEMPVPQLTVVLMGLEVLGHIRRLPGARYETVY